MTYLLLLDCLALLVITGLILLSGLLYVPLDLGFPILATAPLVFMTV